MELQDIVTEIKKQFESAKGVTNFSAIDTAIITVYCTLTGAQPKDLKPYFEKLKEVSDYSGEDTALLACCAHYKMNKQTSE